MLGSGGTRGGVRSFALVVLALAAVWTVSAWTPRAAAADGEAIAGRLSGPGAEAAGVEVTVRSDGAVVGSAVTDGKGAFVVPVPGPGTYQVSLDVSTLPKGAALADASKSDLPRVVVQPGRAKTVVFALEEAKVEVTTGGDRFVSALLSGLRFGLVVAISAVGLTLVFSTTGTVNFAHGELVTFGGVVTWYLNDAGLTLVVAAAIACVAGALLGAGLELGLWRPLERRKVGTVTCMVISIALALILRNLVLVVFDGRPRVFRDGAAQRSWRLGPIEILPKSILVIAIALVVMALLAALARRTRAGTAIRAIADDGDLAEASGIDVRRNILIVWMVAGALAALGGAMLGATDAVSWDMGLRILLVMFASIVVGGMGSVTGAVVGGLIVGIASEVSGLWLPTDFKLVVALVALVAVLLVRPTGVLGLRERVG